MRFLILICMAATLNTYSQELIWSYDQNKQIRSQMSENPLLLKRKLFGMRRIDSDFLGTATSPFYLNSGQPTRNYKNYLNKCFKVTVLKTKTIATYANCSEKPNLYIDFEGERFKQFDNFISLEDQMFEANDFEYQRSFYAFHDREEDVLSSEEPNNLKYSQVSLNVSMNRKVQVNEYSLKLTSKLSVARGKYTYLSTRTKDVVQTLQFKKNSRDFVFKSGKRLLLFKRYQPSPLDFGLLGASESYIDYLENLESFFYPFNDQQRCFKDTTYTPKEYDCDQLIFKTQVSAAYNRLGIILLDLNKHSIQLLQI